MYCSKVKSVRCLPKSEKSKHVLNIQENFLLHVRNLVRFSSQISF